MDDLSRRGDLAFQFAQPWPTPKAYCFANEHSSLALPFSTATSCQVLAFKPPASQARATCPCPSLTSTTTSDFTAAAQRRARHAQGSPPRAELPISRNCMLLNAWYASANIVCSSYCISVLAFLFFCLFIFLSRVLPCLLMTCSDPCVAFVGCPRCLKFFGTAVRIPGA